MDALECGSPAQRLAVTCVPRKGKALSCSDSRRDAGRKTLGILLFDALGIERLRSPFRRARLRTRCTSRLQAATVKTRRIQRPRAQHEVASHDPFGVTQQQLTYK